VTATTNARIAGFTFLFYIAAGVGSLALGGQAHLRDVLTLLTSFCALVLAVTLYALTRKVDRDVAMIALLCRFVEGIPGHDGGAIFFATGSTLFCWLLVRGRMIPAALAWLGVLASLGLVALLLLQRAAVLGVTNWSSSVTWLVWLPMLIFELAFAAWLIVKGVEPPELKHLT